MKKKGQLQLKKKMKSYPQNPLHVVHNIPCSQGLQYIERKLRELGEKFCILIFGLFAFIFRYSTPCQWTNRWSLRTLVLPPSRSEKTVEY